LPRAARTAGPSLHCDLAVTSLCLQVKSGSEGRAPVKWRIRTRRRRRWSWQWKKGNRWDNQPVTARTSRLKTDNKSHIPNNHHSVISFCSIL